MRKLTTYHQQRQRLPLKLPAEPHTGLTLDFETLQQTCKKPDLKQWQGCEWISETTWKQISNHLMLRQTGQLCQTTARRLQGQIWASIRNDQATPTKEVGTSIEHELSGGNVQEAFRHLKGRYQAASETTTHPCPQTMDRQTTKRVALYARRDSPGEPLPINIPPVDINDETPSDDKIWVAMQELSDDLSLDRPNP
jgi:hypothetical protein